MSRNKGFKQGDFALYKGDKFIIIGTLKQIAEYLGCKENTAYFYTTNCYKKRVINYEKSLLVIKIENEV